MATILKSKCLINYKKRISCNMIQAKDQEVLKLQDRADISQILTLKLDNSELNKNIIAL